jgi:hypothetical protein
MDMQPSKLKDTRKHFDGPKTINNFNKDNKAL